MKLIIPLIAALFCTSVFSACLETTAENIGVKFTAFKTPLKLGVSAKFTDKKLSKKASGASWSEAAMGNTISIDTSKIDSGDKARDAKIVKFFFEDQIIEATVTKVDEKKKQMILTISMGGTTLKKVAMNYQFKADKLSAEGYVDILDFGMSKQLAALNKACFAKHEGKTWSDVKIEFSALFGKCK